ncbi:ATP-binding protein [Brevibacillus thermoruber]|uniref:ATP-binding protein n=1 Tax=Brevibacillus thermoruber TaxID=33942 RepID=UPI0006855E26|nr:ATP-binding protein [Brevibacillus thermoruber]
MRSNGQERNYKAPKTDDTLSRLASIGQIAAGIAHEVRNPLTAVKGFLQLLQEEISHGYLDIACSELDQAIATLQDLLQVSKPDLEEESYISINLCSELESLLYLFQDQIYRVQIVRNFRNSDEVICGKRNQLKKAFFNLLKNAFEAIPHEGIISIEHYRMGDFVFVSISDTGVGVPQEKLQLLGTPFFTTKDEGTGMGLTQVFSTIYQHGGTIDVKSREGIGTTFTIQFPIEMIEQIGVMNLNMQYVEGQSFQEYFVMNQDRFHELFAHETKGTNQLIEASMYNIDVQDIFDRMAKLLVEERQHELTILAKELGKTGARNDVPLVIKLELIQAFRKVYWNLLHNYYQHVGLDMEGVFQLGIKTNFILDHYIFHYFSSYIEYKDELLRSHRETIDDLSVPIIPLSASMAVLPIVGTLDTYRAKKVQERTLNQIASLKIQKIIIDLSGVAFMDTAVVGHLFRIVEGIGLLGCKAIITGIRPEIANTMIELGIVFTEKVDTKATLQQALEEYQ